MNKNAEKWVQALESGDYLQTTGYLEMKHGTEYFHCVMGVACRLYAKEHPEWPVMPSVTSNDRTCFGEGSVSIIPAEVLEWIGVRNVFGAFGSTNKEDEAIVGLNDSGRTFEEIAVVIRSEPEGLFHND